MVSFFAPEAEPDPFAENVNVIVQDVADRTLAQYTEASVAELRQMLPAGEIVRSEDTVLSGRPGHTVESTGTVGDRPLHIWQTWTLASGRAFAVTYTADGEDYEAFLPDARRILASFEITLE